MEVLGLVGWQWVGIESGVASILTKIDVGLFLCSPVYRDRTTRAVPLTANFVSGQSQANDLDLETARAAS